MVCLFSTEKEHVFCVTRLISRILSDANTLVKPSLRFGSWLLTPQRVCNWPRRPRLDKGGNWRELGFQTDALPSPAMNVACAANLFLTVNPDKIKAYKHRVMGYG